MVIATTKFMISANAPSPGGSVDSPGVSVGTPTPGGNAGITCASGFQVVNGACSPINIQYTCVSGFTYISGVCVQNSNVCPDGYFWNGAVCVQTTSGSCPTGFTWNGTTCVSGTVAGASGSGLCPAGTTFDGTYCVQDTPTPTPAGPNPPATAAQALTNIRIPTITPRGTFAKIIITYKAAAYASFVQIVVGSGITGTYKYKGPVHPIPTINNAEISDTVAVPIPTNASGTCYSATVQLNLPNNPFIVSSYTVLDTEVICIPMGPPLVGVSGAAVPVLGPEAGAGTPTGGGGLFNLAGLLGGVLGGLGIFPESKLRAHLPQFLGGTAPLRGGPSTGKGVPPSRARPPDPRIATKPTPAVVPRPAAAPRPATAPRVTPAAAPKIVTTTTRIPTPVAASKPVVKAVTPAPPRPAPAPRVVTQPARPAPRVVTQPARPAPRVVTPPTRKPAPRPVRFARAYAAGSAAGEIINVNISPANPPGSSVNIMTTFRNNSEGGEYAVHLILPAAGVNVTSTPVETLASAQGVIQSAFTIPASYNYDSITGIVELIQTTTTTQRVVDSEDVVVPVQIPGAPGGCPPGQHVEAGICVDNTAARTGEILNINITPPTNSVVTMTTSFKHNGNSNAIYGAHITIPSLGLDNMSDRLNLPPDGEGVIISKVVTEGVGAIGTIELIRDVNGVQRVEDTEQFQIPDASVGLIS